MTSSPESHSAESPGAEPPLKKRMVNGALEVPEGMSKKAFKRELKKRKMEEDREAFMEQRRIKRREDRARQREKRKAEPPKPPVKSQGPAVVADLDVIVDCDFDTLMKDNERSSLARQLELCHSHNRHAQLKVRLQCTSINGQLAQWLDTVMRGNHHRWKDTQMIAEPFVKTDRMIYLSSDSTETLDTLEDGYTYIIGGIVDKGRYKNLCQSKAEEMGIPTARLPIDEHIKLSGRRVLTTNHVFELLLKWLELRDWKLAFEAVLPTRKLTKAPEISEEPKSPESETSSKQETPRSCSADQPESSPNTDIANA